MEKQTGSKYEKEYVKAVYCHPAYLTHVLEKEMATHSSVLTWRIPGTGSLVGYRLWGRTESDTTEAT